MKNRSIKKVIAAQKVNMGGIILDQPLPDRQVDQIDPFLLIHHWANDLKGGKKQSDAGVGPHPHRGFSPVTFIFQGGVHHRDSVGNDEVVYAGGTQWMNAGKGVVHSERPAKELAEAGGPFEIIQFWINTPAKFKMDEPEYLPLSKENTPTWLNDKAEVGVIAGEFSGTKGTIVTKSPMLILRVNLQKGGKVSVPVPESYNALLYQLDGKMVINEDKVTTAKDMIWFANDGEGILLEAKEDTRLIFLSGEPIREPVASYGPFVMSNQQELIQAVEDFQSGKMGELRESF